MPGLFVNQQFGDASFISFETLANPPAQLINNMSGVYITPDGVRYVSNGTTLVSSGSQITALDINSSTFPIQVNLYNVDEPGVTAGANSVVANDNGTHTEGRTAFNATIVSEGSGAESGPQRAGFAITASAFKKTFPSTAAVDGEIDTINATVRQVNGDAATALLNGVIINGFGALVEGNFFSIDPVTFDFVDGVNIQLGVVNDRDTDYRGLRVSKVTGDGGTGLSVDSEIDGDWSRLIDLAKTGQLQLSFDADTASLFLFEVDSPAEFNELRSINEELYIYNASGVEVGARIPNYISWVPVLTATVPGSPGLDYTINEAKYWLSGQEVNYRISCTMNNINGASGALLVTMPVAQGPRIYSGCGTNASTGQGLATVIAGGSLLQIRSVAGTFPVANGHQFAVEGRYWIA